MPLIPENVFEDGEVLCSVYRRLTRLAGEQKPRRKGGTKSRRRAVQVSRVRKQLKKLDRQLLFTLTPEVFERVILCMWRDQMPMIMPMAHPLMSRLLHQAGASAKCAKRLAHLFFHVLLCNLRLSPDELDRCSDLLFHCLRAGSCDPDTLGSHEPESFRFIDQLICAADQGDKEAHYYLCLLHRAVRLFRFDIQPMLPGDFREEHRQQCWDSLFIGSHEGSKTLPFPTSYSAQRCERLRRVRSDEVKPMGELDRRPLDEFWGKIASIPFTAYQGFLTSLWSFICEQESPLLVLSGRQDKVVIKVSYFNHNWLRSFAFRREHSDGAGLWSYPGVGVDLFFCDLYEKYVLQISLAAEGGTVGFERTSWPIALVATLMCIVVDAYAEIVIPEDRKGGPGDPRKKRPRLLKPHHRDGEVVTVRSHFPRLPQGWKASLAQIEKAIRETGMPPGEGRTYVGEHQRGFPGVLMPYREAVDAYSTHEIVAPSIIVDETHVEALLEHIPSFG